MVGVTSLASRIDREIPVHPTLEAARRTALSRFVDGQPGDWDPQAAALATRLAGDKPDPAFVDLFVAVAGIEGALDALLAADDIGRYAKRNANGDYVVTVAPHDPNYSHAYRELSSGIPKLFASLRTHVRAADALAYARAREHAKGRRESATPSKRAAIAFTFPNEPAWAAADLPSADEELPPWCGLLLTSLDDIRAIERLVDGEIDFDVPLSDGRIDEVIERFGLAALPFVRRLLRRPTLRAGLVRALAKLDGPDVAEIMLGVAVDPGARDGVATWLAHHPESALPAMTKAYGTGASAKSKVIGPILSSLIAKNRAAAIAFAATLPPKSRNALAALGASETWLPTSHASIDRLLDGPLEEGVAAPWKDLVTWLRSGAPAAGRACIDGVVRVSGPRVLEHLGELARTLARHGGLACAQAIVDALEALGTMPAVREISRITIQLADASLTEHAEDALRRLGPRLELDEEDILDLGVPDYGIHGPPMTLDFGPRSFRVKIDATFVPKLFDSEGEPLKSLPRPNRKDDAAKAERAAASWSRLRDEATAEAKRQARRFEEAMIAGRRWSGRVDSGLLQNRTGTVRLLPPSWPRELSPQQ